MLIFLGYLNRRRSSVKSASVRFPPNFFAKLKKKAEDKETWVTQPPSEVKSAISKRFYPVPEFIDHDAIGSIEKKPTVLGIFYQIHVPLQLIHALAGSSDSLDLIMKTRLGRKWRRRTQRAKEELNQETQTSEIELFTDLLLHAAEGCAEEATKRRVKKRRKPAKAMQTVNEAESVPTKVTAVAKVKAAIQARKLAEEIATPVKQEVLGAMDMLQQHRPKTEEEAEVVELKKSRLTQSKDSLELARESMEARLIIKQAEESKLNMVRDSLEVLRVIIKQFPVLTHKTNR